MRGLCARGVLLGRVGAGALFSRKTSQRGLRVFHHRAREEVVAPRSDDFLFFDTASTSVERPADRSTTSSAPCFASVAGWDAQPGDV